MQVILQTLLAPFTIVLRILRNLDQGTKSVDGYTQSFYKDLDAHTENRNSEREVRRKFNKYETERRIEALNKRMSQRKEQEISDYEVDTVLPQLMN
ncbi:hypothetical protein [Alteromonas sp. RKMC-009]|uniref:hypothetical protein n=1 Tax=Alteromonas sp. RKMC-009 TaxID=2267264 RepID=UPI000E6A4AE3|nr:hypothetical protein [Alteromonas sp. RKMC-009]AYA64307.1 hypothetical protein DS731_10030 [Alteromonas sp. RKMC-009]